MFLCFCVVLLFSLNSLLSLSCSLSLSLSFFSLFLSSLFCPSSLFSLLSSLPLPRLSSLLATKHHGENGSTNTAANIEAFECDLAHGKCTAVGSLRPPSSLPPTPRKKMRGLFITGIFRARELFFITVLNKIKKIAAGENYSHYSFIFIPKQ